MTYLCTAPGTVIHEWKDDEPFDTRLAHPALRDCPDHDGTPKSEGPRPIDEFISPVL